LVVSFAFDRLELLGIYLQGKSSSGRNDLRFEILDGNLRRGRNRVFADNPALQRAGAVKNPVSLVGMVKHPIFAGVQRALHYPWVRTAQLTLKQPSKQFKRSE
jgi:hypothetical protein